jgi:hypothetical protein
MLPIMSLSPGKGHTSPVNYSPISLLRSSGKLFGETILRIPNFQLRELKVIRDDQYGFERGLLNLERITHGFNNKATVTLFLDIRRPFDKI